MVALAVDLPAPREGFERAAALGLELRTGRRLAPSCALTPNERLATLQHLESMRRLAIGAARGAVEICQRMRQNISAAEQEQLGIRLGQFVTTHITWRMACEAVAYSSYVAQAQILLARDPDLSAEELRQGIPMDAAAFDLMMAMETAIIQSGLLEVFPAYEQAATELEQIMLQKISTE